MDNFLNMSINDFVELKEDIKIIKEYNEKINNSRHLNLFKDNIWFFNQISYDIENKLRKVYDDYDDDDD
jgi:hypothetical protein